MRGDLAVRFDDVWALVRAFLEKHAEQFAGRVVVVRDLYGRIRLVLDDRKGAAIEEPTLRGLAKELDSGLGAWSPGVASIFLLASKMFAPAEVFDSSDILWADPARRDYRILDRTVIGSDWLREPFEPAGEGPARVTLFGIKGGVGRSTATAVLAWRLAQAGRQVLVVDLDLESPGVGTTLLPHERSPDYGLVDWFIEDGVGQADEALLRDMAGLSPLGSGGAELWVVPAGGRPREGYEYLAKLARAYAEGTSAEGRLRGFGDRLHEVVQRLETFYKPDIVLLDSRAGLHDIAAVTVTRLNAVGLLFAVDSAQTWSAYRALFEVWHRHYDRAAQFRENLKMVAAQIPETETLPYLASFQQAAYDLFAENLYVETGSGEVSDFNFDLQDPEAPHTPLRIHWSRAFQQFDPVNRPGAVTEEQLRAAFGDIVDGVSSLLLGEKLG